MSDFVFEAHGEQDTDRFGAILADALTPGTVVSLRGTLGAGKTRLVQAVAEALGVDRQDVTSPTFVLVRRYEGRLPIYHLDAYRLRDDDEFLELGPEEFYSSPAITFIEWGEKVQACLPRQHLEIQIEVLGEHARRFRVRAIGQKYTDTIARLTSDSR
jgi:tRNA threonylcarbamoyladenosine biosynthesis protein TsaE